MGLTPSGGGARSAARAGLSAVLGISILGTAATARGQTGQDGDGTGIDNPTGQTQADPEIRQEIARLKEGTSGGNRSLLREWGGIQAGR